MMRSASATLPGLRLHRVAAFLALVLACVFSGVGYMAIEHERDHMDEVIEESARAQNRWVGLALTRIVEQVLSGSPARALGEERRAELDGQFAGIAQAAPLLGVRLIGADGAVVHAWGDAAAGGASAPAVHDVSAAGRASFPVVRIESRIDVSGAVASGQAELAAYRRWLIVILAGFYAALVLAILWGTLTIQRLARSRVSALEAISESQQLLVDGLESMSDAVVIVDGQFRVQLWNAAYLRFFPQLAGVIHRDYPWRRILESVAAMPAYGIPEPERVAWVEETYRRVTTRTEDYRRTLADGRVWVVMTRRTASGGRIQTLRDVTSELAAQRDLAAAKQLAEESGTHLRDAVESLDDGFVLLDAEQRAVLWNARYPALLPPVAAVLRPGATLRELVATLPGSLLYAIPPDQHEAWIEAALPRLWDGPPFIRRLSDGRHLRIAGTPTRTGGRILALRDVSEDVKAKEKIELENTARKEQEQRLAEALAREREIVAQQRRFVAVTAHEFRTPLTIIDGAAQRLARYAEQMAPGDLRERAARIRGAVQRMSELVNTTLNSAQLDEGRIALNLVSLDLAELVVGVARRLTGMAPEFDIVVSRPPEPLRIEGDPRLLDQVFANLISNAIKYSGASRRVEISAIGEGETAVVRVRDHGIGIPEAEIDQLFTRFFRASTAKGLPGTGIGLNLVRELAALHGGDVRVESHAGDGTTFIVTLPRRASAFAGGDAVGDAAERMDGLSRAGRRPS